MFPPLAISCLGIFWMATRSSKCLKRVYKHTWSSWLQSRFNPLTRGGHAYQLSALTACVNVDKLFTLNLAALHKEWTMGTEGEERVRWTESSTDIHTWPGDMHTWPGDMHTWPGVKQLVGAAPQHRELSSELCAEQEGQDGDGRLLRERIHVYR